MSGKIREIGGMPLRWGDRQGVIHAVEGAEMITNQPDTFLLWTICGNHDVPANTGVRSHAKVTCQECLEYLAETSS